MAARYLPHCLERLRARAPLVQNITNTVVQGFSANVLLALGASPAMLDHEADAAQFAGLADALLVNYGTATNQQLLAADVAIGVMVERRAPWVLDPVSVGAVDFRTRKIRQTLARAPSVVRANASEVLALAGAGVGGRGVDAVDAVEAALPAALALARQTGAVIAVSGPVDAIVAVWDRRAHCARVAGGHALMPRVVGTGCALGSAVAAYLAGAERAERPERERVRAYFEATVAAHLHFALAGARAGAQAAGPGSFAVAFLDALYALQPADLAAADGQVEVGLLDEGVRHD